MLSNKISFKSQFFIAIMGAVIISLFAGFSYNLYTSYKYKKESFIHESELQAGLIADSAVAPMLFFDRDGLSASLAQLKRYENIMQVLVFTNNNELFSSYKKDKKQKNIQREDEDMWFLKDGEKSDAYNSTSFVIKQRIMLNDEDYGNIYLQKSTKQLSDFARNSIYQTILFASILMAVLVFLVYQISQKLITPIEQLSNKLFELSKSQNYSIRLESDSQNEIGKLYQAFNNLFNSIEIHQDSRDEALAQAKSYQEHLVVLTQELEKRVEDRTKELQKTIDTLKKAQNQLVESEKMAALGALVSGVAHEVNTPLGNAVTGSTIIKQETTKLLRCMQDGTLKKSTLEESLRHIDETSHLLFKSINTAADLIRSFKKISIDQSIEQKREFNIVEYVDEIVKTFRNKLKQIPVDVEIIAEESIIINSYPGVLAQILNNFIQNSIIHGFEHKRDTAKITIEIEKTDKNLHFVYKDNGAGMSDKFKLKAFEPFVTTKRNAGGTGLGLNIVYNIITQKLNGSITLDTKQGEGTSFIIDIPT
jgi:signal transduction histidine kinase